MFETNEANQPTGPVMGAKDEKPVSRKDPEVAPKVKSSIFVF